jgi:CopG family transcriptional regulator/antitoxin EndoAI
MGRSSGIRFAPLDTTTNLTYTTLVCKLQVSKSENKPLSKRINIVLPDKTLAVLDRVAARGARSRFIDRAVRHYVETQGRHSLREQLKAGYRANAERDLAMAAEWYPLEEEAWRTLEESRRPKKTGKAKQT